MKNIKSIEKITSIHNTWKPSDIAFIKSIELSNNNLLIVFYCQLRSRENEWPDRSKGFFEVSLKFKNIVNLKLDINGKGLYQVSGFDILDVSDNGLEGINFLIEDYESGSINFYCEDIDVDYVLNSVKVKFI